MNTQEQLIQEIRNQPEIILREVLHYLKFLERQHRDEEWSDVLPGREIEQEVLDILDSNATYARRSLDNRSRYGGQDPTGRCFAR